MYSVHLINNSSVFTRLSIVYLYENLHATIVSIVNRSGFSFCCQGNHVGDLACMPLGVKFVVFGFTIVCINIWVFPGFSLRFLFWRGSCRIATTHNRFMFIIAREN
jgi:hypothetical protein